MLQDGVAFAARGFKPPFSPAPVGAGGAPLLVESAAERASREAREVAVAALRKRQKPARPGQRTALHEAAMIGGAPAAPHARAAAPHAAFESAACYSDKGVRLPKYATWPVHSRGDIATKG